MLGIDIANLEPDHHRVPEGASRVPGDFKKSRAEKEDDPRIGRRAELPVDRQAQHIPVELLAPAQVGGAQQDPAAQYLHAAILAAHTPSGTGTALAEHVLAAYSPLHDLR